MHTVDYTFHHIRITIQSKRNDTFPVIPDLIHKIDAFLQILHIEHFQALHSVVFDMDSYWVISINDQPLERFPQNWGLAMIDLFPIHNLQYLSYSQLTDGDYLPIIFRLLSCSSSALPIHLDTYQFILKCLELHAAIQPRREQLKTWYQQFMFASTLPKSVTCKFDYPRLVYDGGWSIKSGDHQYHITASDSDDAIFSNIVCKVYGMKYELSEDITLEVLSIGNRYRQARTQQYLWQDIAQYLRSLNN